MSSEAPKYVLPAAVITRADLARLVREVEQLDNEFEVQKVRDHRDEGHYAVPNMSQGLNDFLAANSVKIADSKERTALKDHLRVLKDKAPIVHVTFAVDADPDFLQQLVEWLRREAHPYSLLSVGLQPSLIGGMHMRTPNHVHDYSLRKIMAGKRELLVNELKGLGV